MLFPSRFLALPKPSIAATASHHVALSNQSLQKRTSPFRDYLTPEFFGQIVQQQRSAAVLRNPFDRTLSEFSFDIKLTISRKTNAVIELSSKDTSTYPFTVLNARMCAEIYKSIEQIERKLQDVSTITLAGTGRSFLVAPRLSFLSKLCVGGMKLAFEAENDDSVEIPLNVPLTSIDERVKDYGDIFDAFAKLHACINFESAQEYLSFVESMRVKGMVCASTSKVSPMGFEDYVNRYCDRLIANKPSCFTKKLLITAINGLTFGLGKEIAQSTEIRYGNTRTAWDCTQKEYNSAKALCSFQKDVGRENPGDLEIHKRFQHAFSDASVKPILESYVRKEQARKLGIYPHTTESTADVAKLSPPDEVPRDVFFLSAEELFRTGNIARIIHPANYLSDKVGEMAEKFGTMGVDRVRRLKRILRNEMVQ